MLGQRNGEEWIPFTIAGTTYYVNRRGSEEGCIQGDAITELADALNPVLDSLPGLYEGIDDPEYRGK